MSRWIYFVGVLFTLCTLFAFAQRYSNRGPQCRSTKLPVAVASSPACRGPYRHDFTDGTVHYVSRSVFCSCFASLKTTSTRFYGKRKKLPLCSRIPLVIHLGDYCRMKLSQAESGRVRRATTNTLCGLLCQRTVPPVLPAFRMSLELFERLLASPACPSGVSSIVDGEKCGALVE